MIFTYDEIRMPIEIRYTPEIAAKLKKTYKNAYTYRNAGKKLEMCWVT